MIRITQSIAIDEREISESFVRASGPGGQNVNKVSTAVQLRFDVLHSPSLTDDVRRRLMRLGGKRVSEEGVLVIEAKRFRSQERNRQDARARLVDMVRRVASGKKPRRRTRPTAVAKERRLESKRRRAGIKRMRRPPPRS